MPVQWKDREKGYENPVIESSETRLGVFRLTVHRHIHHPPDVWLASCRDLFSQVALESKDIDLAKDEAIAKVRVVLENALQDIEGV